MTEETSGPYTLALKRGNTMPIFHNFSSVVRAIDRVKKAVLGDIGDTLAVGIMEEFDRLLNETAQYTGTTAASWRVSMGGAGKETVNTQAPRSRVAALKMGHQHAVNVARMANTGALDDISKAYRYSAIVIENDAPGADAAEHGPLRDVNAGAEGAFERFKGRIRDRSFKVIRNRKI